MSFRPKGSLYRLPIIAIAILVFGGASYAVPTVNIVGPGGSCTTPSGQYSVCATTSGFSNSIAKVVFYRNDVPVETDTSSTYQLTPSILGQDTYTFRARAYDTNGVWADSAIQNFTVKTPRVFRMGDAIPQPSPSPSIQTQGPGEAIDHTTQIQAALNYLSGLGGGTLVFPCTVGPLGRAIYNIRDTITVPSNVTLQGEGADDMGKCRVYWYDPGISPQDYDCDGDSHPSLVDKPMFKLAGGTHRVRFKDLYLTSRATGTGEDDIGCFGGDYQRSDWETIADDHTSGIEMSAESDNITDVILENVTISHFTNGIKAVSNSTTGYGISEIRIRAYRAVGNHRQIFINARYAWDWDVQNLNINQMFEAQGGVEIVRAGKPSGTTSENPKIKFLELNCNGSRESPVAFCVRVEKHGGLYFRQLHHEGVDRAIEVDNIAPNGETNSDPIVFESSIASGLFKDPSMKLYLIGNTLGAPEPIPSNWDDIRLRFTSTGLNSTVVDCGDIHWDYTDVDGLSLPFASWKMMYTHSERNRASFFSESGGTGTIAKAHTYCPSAVSGLTNINEVGGDFFDSGLLPTEATTTTYTAMQYTRVLNSTTLATCQSGNVADCIEYLLDYGQTPATHGGTIYIDGQFPVDRTINIPRGSQIVGASGAELILEEPDVPLLRITLLLEPDFRTAGIALRNFKLSTAESGATGIEFIGGTPDKFPGSVPPSSDMHFSGLTFEGFNIGLKAWPVIEDPDARTIVYGQSPMLDGYSMKNLTFLGNETAVDIFSANTSNWNVMNLDIQTPTLPDTVGWRQKYGGHVGMQGVNCQGGALSLMQDCLNLQMVNAFYLNGLKKTQYVTNAVSIGEGFSPYNTSVYFGRQYAMMTFRNSDFTSAGSNMGQVNLIGKSFIVSMNNKYNEFSVDPDTEADQSRVTYCGDTYLGSGGTPYPGLEPLHRNEWVGAPTPTRVLCGTRPMPWDDVTTWGGNAGDVPLVGNFFDNTREDFVIYRPGSTGQFLVKQAGGTGSQTINLGTTGDTPLIGRFYANAQAQVIAYTPRSYPLSSLWTVKDCDTASSPTCTTSSWGWGVSGDTPFVGNFISEYGTSDDKDEVGIYRPSLQMFCIYNPRTTTMVFRTTTADIHSVVQVADFLGAGYDQLGQYKAGVWKIIDMRDGSTYTATQSETWQSGDVPVAGKYLPQVGTKHCAQLAFWRPGAESRLYVEDPPFTGCGGRSTTSIVWGSDNENPFDATHYDDDIPLTMNTASGPLRRPVAYRPTKGAYPAGIANGQWWVHDLF